MQTPFGTFDHKTLKLVWDLPILSELTYSVVDDDGDAVPWTEEEEITCSSFSIGDGVVVWVEHPVKRTQVRTIGLYRLRVEEV